MPSIDLPTGKSGDLSGPCLDSSCLDYVLCDLFEGGSLSMNLKPPLSVFPPIWSHSRQEVCESFDWFRSYQGGVYFNKGWVKGYLLGGFSASRDIFHDNGKLIVSHGGGKAAVSPESGNGSGKASDQLENDKSVGALLNTYREGRAIALIIDDRYALFPYSIAAKGCTYAVLGWYQIVKAWAEYQSDLGTGDKVIRYKFAFQWCEQQGEPWWWKISRPPGHAELALALTSDTQGKDLAAMYACPRCGDQSPVIYEPPMCHKPSCAVFCCIRNTQQSRIPAQYSAHFIRHHPVKVFVNDLAELEPPLPKVLSGTEVATSGHFCKGWHCKTCGRLSSRFKWENFECRNCGAIHVVGGRLRTAKEVTYQRISNSSAQSHHPSITAEPPQVFPMERGLCLVRETYSLPERRGKIHIIRSASPISDEVDRLFELYQVQANTGDLKLRRWPMRTHKCRGTLLTKYFSQNAGEPYRYVGGDENSIPFEAAPSAINTALDLIRRRIRQAELPFGNEFNELLTVAYMETQTMGYHSDAEKGLGPNVASLSLGASATMCFRLHSKYHTGGPREVLKLFLCHGDVLVMEGGGVQTYYEHTVIPLNFRIAATARFIGKDHH